MKKEFKGEVNGKNELIKYEERGTATNFAVEVETSIPTLKKFTFYVKEGKAPMFLVTSDDKIAYKIMTLIYAHQSSK